MRVQIMSDQWQALFEFHIGDATLVEAVGMIVSALREHNGARALTLLDVTVDGRTWTSTAIYCIDDRGGIKQANG